MPRKTATELDGMMLTKGYASVRHVAKKLGRDIATVYRMLRECKLAGVKVGDQQFIAIESVKAWAGEQAVDLLNLRDWG